MSNKCTLRKVNEGVVATVDEIPKIGDWSYNTITNLLWFNDFNEKYLYAEQKIIASTFGVGKELVAHYIGFEPKFNINGVLEIGKEYEYTETETNVIIKL